MNHISFEHASSSSEPPPSPAGLSLSVMKQASLFPIETEIAFPIQLLSRSTLEGPASVPLRLRQRVHVALDDQHFWQATVRRVWGSTVKLGLTERVAGSCEACEGDLP